MAGKRAVLIGTCCGSIGPVTSSRLRSSCASTMRTMLVEAPNLPPRSSAAAVEPIDLVGNGSQHPKTSAGKLLCWGETGAAITPEQVLHTLHRRRAPRSVRFCTVRGGRLVDSLRSRNAAGAALQIVDLARWRLIFARFRTASIISQTTLPLPVPNLGAAVGVLVLGSGRVEEGR